ncbi:MAG TPA: PKD domain-containing protein [Thermoanaerobaculia bacterium]|nr:PKD domain-containing protein [Thermoanaerobaculia bacterium]
MTQYLPRPRRVPALATGLMLALVAATVPSFAHAKGCSEGTPAAQVPATLWGSLQPAGIVSDSSRYTGQQRSDSNLPIHTYLDIENGHIFVSYFSGFSVWNASGANAGDPQQLSAIDGWRGHFAVFAPSGEFKDMIFGIDAPAGDDSIVAVSGRAPVGVSIWDTTNKSNPKQLYQDHTTRFADQVYAAKIGTRQYAFAADGSSSDSGLHVYDMTAARQHGSNTCTENIGSGVRTCGVYVGKVGSRGVRYVAGVSHNNRHYVATSAALLSPRGVEVWDVTNPSSPQLVASALNSSITYGVAMWVQDGRAYLATRTEATGKTSEQGHFFELTGSSLQPKATVNLPSAGSSVDWKSATYSRSGNTPFVYFGDNLLCVQGAANSLRHEALYDVSNASSPKEVSPKATIGHPDDPALRVDYWSWYYSTFTKGYSHVAPRVGKFLGTTFYRAASSLFDAHEWHGSPDQPPAASFSWSPQQAYPGDPITFTDTSTGSVVARDWTFPDGTPGSSTAANPTVSFATKGPKSVSLEVSDPGLGASDTEVRQVTILDPAPKVASVTANVTDTFVCQQVTFTANGVTGKAPLSFAWKVQQNEQDLVPAPSSPNSATFAWNTTGVPAGTYQGVVTVSGTGAPAVGYSPPVTLLPLPTLPTSFVATHDPFVAGTVQFHAAVPGATEWSWDFDDDANAATTHWGAWSQDPVAGPNPVHTYSSTGVRTVRVRVRNCQQTTPVESSPVVVNIEQVAPLQIVVFRAQGCVIFCDFTKGDTVTFEQEFAGEPTSYEYDWEGDGTFVTSTSPILTHQYNQVGSYTPVLRVRRGAEEVIRTHGKISVAEETVTPPPPPPPAASLAISGPSTGAPEANLTFTASANNCSPSPSGWSWIASGATITGSGNSVAIRWPTTGTKTVRVTNSACGTVQALKTVRISSGGDEPPPDERPSVQAAYSFTPAAPEPGQSVTFNGSASTGSPTGYSWDFGDGQFASGMAVSHTFANAGTYQVKLTVEKASDAPGCNVGICPTEKHTITKTVTVADSGSTCADGKLCLVDGNFEIEVDWLDHRNGNRTGVGSPKSVTDNTGMFTFFNQDNVELIVKVLNGESANGNWWVFYGGLSDVQYTIRVTDKTATPPRVKTYTNLAGTICGVGDTAAFPSTAAASSTAGGVSVETGATHGGGGSGDVHTLLLQDRFKVTVDWRDHRNGGTGSGTAVPGTSKSGYFWFFNPVNYELVVKILDGRPVNGYWWVLWGGLSDVEYDLRVEDTVTGEVWEHHNPAGSLCGGADNAAFAGN